MNRGAGADEPGMVPWSFAEIAGRKPSRKNLVAARPSERNRRHLVEVIAFQLDRVRLGMRAARGGLLVDHFQSKTLELAALQDLQKLTNRLDAILCRNVVKAMHESETIREPIATILRREIRWTCLGSGWWLSWDSTVNMAKSVLGSNAANTATSTVA